jgi:exodeoxyribonuclease VII small subunit
MSENKQTIEVRIAALETKVAWFDGEDFELDKAIEQYEEAQKMANEITEQLDQLKNTIIRLDKTA